MHFDNTGKGSFGMKTKFDLHFSKFQTLLYGKLRWGDLTVKKKDQRDTNCLFEERDGLYTLNVDQ